jgi:hypothetical protein
MNRPWYVKAVPIGAAWLFVVVQTIKLEPRINIVSNFPLFIFLPFQKSFPQFQIQGSIS